MNLESKELHIIARLPQTVQKVNTELPSKHKNKLTRFIITVPGAFFYSKIFFLQKFAL